MSRDYIAEARQYSQDVLSGVIPTCKLTKLAVQRQLNDLAWADRNDRAFPYVFSEEAASRICRYIEMHPFVDGGKDVAGKKIHLQPWQSWLVTTAWGWLQRHTGYRRFRRAYTSVGKGNGKSCLSSPMCNYAAFAEGVPGAQVFTAATTREQAKVVFKPAAFMLKAMPSYCKKAGIEIAGPAKEPTSIYQQRTNSFVRPLSSEFDSLEGIKPAFICVDELHAHQKRDLYDNLDTSNGKMPGSMLWAITTAGTNRSSVCYELHQFVTDILEGHAHDETTFGVIYGLDTEDSPWDETSWRKANPNWGISVDPIEIAAKAAKAKQVPSAQNAFLTKHGNVWCNADVSGLPIADWDACAEPDLDIEDYHDDECIVGIDLASRRDLASVVKVFRRWNEEESRWHFYGFQTSWLPEKAIEESPVAQLKGWALDGYLETGSGRSIDLAKVIPQHLDEFAQGYSVKELALDPAKCELVVPALQAKFGEERVVTVSPKGHEMCPAMKELETLLIERRFHHNGDPLYTWAISNVAGHVSQRDSSVFPVRKHRESKIDPAIATMIALRRWTAYADDTNASSSPLVSVITW